MAEVERQFRERPSEKHEAWATYVAPHPLVRDAWQAFWDLDGDRSVLIPPMGGHPIYRGIPYASRSRWLDDHGYVGAARDRMERHLRTLDSRYCAAKNEHEDDEEDEDAEDDGDVNDRDRD